MAPIGKLVVEQHSSGCAEHWGRLRARQAGGSDPQWRPQCGKAPTEFSLFLQVKVNFKGDAERVDRQMAEIQVWSSKRLYYVEKMSRWNLQGHVAIGCVSGLLVQARAGEQPPLGGAGVGTMSDGIAAEFADKRSAPEQPDMAPDYLASLRLALPYLDGSRLKLLATIIIATASVACELVPVWAIYRAVSDIIAGTADWSSMSRLAVLSLAAVVAYLALLGVALALSHFVAYDAIYRLRVAIARHMATLPLGWFADKPSGDAKRQVIDEPEKLELVIAHGLPEGVAAIATWAAVSIWLLAVDYRMALAAIAATPASFVLLSVATARAGRFAFDYKTAQQRMNAAIVEYLAGMAIVKVFNRDGESFAAASDAITRYEAVESAWARSHLPLGGTFMGLVLANVVFITPVGAYLMLRGSLDLATFVFFVVLGANYSAPLLRLFGLFHELAHISMGSMLVSQLMQAKPQSDPRDGIVPTSHDVEFDGVHFGYDSAAPVLHGISFTARAGTVTALVGPSGSGKSTIAGLVPRFYDVTHGHVRLGGVDVRDIPYAALMEKIAFVFQNTALFSDTIARNIRFGKPDASDEAVIAAAMAAQAHDFIMALPNGYETRLGAQGTCLSGGERQRIAIARAILKDAPVVVLDEATAFADPDNETALQRAIEELAAGRTLIVVAHRLHTIVEADTIVLIEDGHVRAAGRHDALLAGDQLYARMWADYTAAHDMPPQPAVPPAPEIHS